MDTSTVTTQKTFIDMSNVRHRANFDGTRTACGYQTLLAPIGYQLRLSGILAGDDPVTCIQCAGIENLVLSGHVYDHGTGRWV